MNKQFAYKQLAFALLGILSMTILGCGPSSDLHKIKGVVKHNGKPVPSLYLTFMPEDPMKQSASSSLTDASGRFELKVGSTGGVAPGSYIVTASDPAALMGGKSSDDPDYKTVCKKYAQGTSKYKITVDKNNSNLELALD